MALLWPLLSSTRGEVDFKIFVSSKSDLDSSVFAGNGLVYGFKILAFSGLLVAFSAGGAFVESWTSKLFVIIVTGRSDVSIMLVDAIDELRNLDVIEFTSFLLLLVTAVVPPLVVPPVNGASV